MIMYTGIPINIRNTGDMEGKITDCLTHIVKLINTHIFKIRLLTLNLKKLSFSSPC